MNWTHEAPLRQTEPCSGPSECISSCGRTTRGLRMPRRTVPGGTDFRTSTASDRVSGSTWVWLTDTSWSPGSKPPWRSAAPPGTRERITITQRPGSNGSWTQTAKNMKWITFKRFWPGSVFIQRLRASCSHYKLLLVMVWYVESLHFMFYICVKLNLLISFVLCYENVLVLFVPTPDRLTVTQRKIIRWKRIKKKM